MTIEISDGIALEIVGALKGYKQALESSLNRRISEIHAAENRESIRKIRLILQYLEPQLDKRWEPLTRA